MGHRTLSDLEDAQQQSVTTARRQIEDAEEYLNHYRSQINRIQETFHQHATYRDVVTEPAFQAGLRRVSEEADENTRAASQAIADLEDDLTAMTARHVKEREDFLAQQRQM
ncbi:hypothetical protein AB4Z18_02325 [Leifsonia sp. 2TAF2]|uniref:hypothetical protein n=1 Tax=Leifsonia sp. 2TAF2 TaxID=3233009 RepID=UPI003F9BBEDA